MKKKILFLLVPLMATPFSESPETTEGFPATTSEIEAEATAGFGFGGKRAQNKRNRRTKKLNKKNGVGIEVTLEDYRVSLVMGKEENHG